VFFVIADIAHPEQKKIADLVGLTFDHLPVIALIHPHGNNIEKYIMTSEDLNQTLT